MNEGDVTSPRWAGGTNDTSAPDGIDYEAALVKEARAWAKREAEELGQTSYSARTLQTLAGAVEALVNDRDVWRDAARTYKASRDASDARAAAARKEALREAADAIEKLDGHFNWDEIHRVAPWLRSLAEGVSDGQQ